LGIFGGRRQGRELPSARRVGWRGSRPASHLGVIRTSPISRASPLDSDSARFPQARTQRLRELNDFSLGWGKTDRTSEWRNQNQFDYPTISRRVWKKRPKHALAISITWEPFPNEKQQMLEANLLAVGMENLGRRTPHGHHTASGSERLARLTHKLLTGFRSISAR
jgi:hypothetical protein